MSEPASTGRAVLVESGTAPADLRLVDVARRSPGPDEVLVEVHAAAVNRSDVLSVRGLMPLTAFPRVPGRDFAGVVVEGPADLRGAEVWGTGAGDLGFSRDGSHAEYLLLPRHAVVPKPAALTLDEAGASGLAFVAASLALDRAGGLATGATALVTGAAGGVGAAASGLARSHGARVIGAVKDAEERKAAEADGIDVIVDTCEQDLVEAVREATDGRGADVAVDTVGAPLLNAVIVAMGFDGGVCFITAPGAHRADFDTLDFYRRDLRLVGLNTSRIDPGRPAQVLRSLLPRFESGQLHPPRIAARHRLDQAPAAYQEVESGQAGGRVLLRPRA